MTAAPAENWGESRAYERYVGRWSRKVAPVFLEWLAVPAGRRWVDVGCGTGALTGAVLEGCAPESVVGVDRAEGFVRAARERFPDGRARFEVGHATALPLESASGDAVVSGLVLNFVPDHAATLREMARVTRPGGTVAAYVWDYAQGMEMMRVFWDAAFTIRPQDAALDESGRFPLCRPGPLAALWRDHGLTDVDVRAIEVPTVFADFADYWEPFLGNQGAAPTYLAALTDDVREAIRREVRSRLVSHADGRIALSARAWAVRGAVR